MDTPAPVSESRAAAAQPLSASSPRARPSARRWPWIAGLAAVVVLAGAAGVRFGVLERLRGGETAQAALFEVRPVTMSITLVESGEIKPRESVEIKCELEGQATLLKIVPESTRVQKGDLLVELASDALTDRLEQESIEVQRVQQDLRAAQADLEIQISQNASDISKATTDVEIAELEVEKYLEGDYKQKLQSIEIDIQQAEMDLKRKEDDLNKNRELRKKGFVTEEKISQLEFELEKAEMSLRRHRTALHTLNEFELRKERLQKDSALARAHEELDRVRKQAETRAGQATEKVAQLQATLNMREGRVRRIQEQLAKCRIHAPSDGIVQYPSDPWGWNESRIQEGAKVHEGQTLLVLPDTSRMLVSTRIHEADRHRIEEGAACIVRVPAVPGKTFTGRVTKIAKFADTANRWLNPELKEHATEILLDETDAPLSPGDSAQIEILIETVENALAVPVQAVHARGRRSYVFVQRGFSAAPVEVKLGRTNITTVEIVDGVGAGDNVLLHADERLLARLPAAGGEGSPGLEEPAEAPTAAAAPQSASAADTSGDSAQTEAAASEADAPAVEEPTAATQVGAGASGDSSGK